jgi:hypothetical protein
LYVRSFEKDKGPVDPNSTETSPEFVEFKWANYFREKMGGKLKAEPDNKKVRGCLYKI